MGAKRRRRSRPRDAAGPRGGPAEAAGAGGAPPRAAAGGGGAAARAESESSPSAAPDAPEPEEPAPPPGDSAAAPEQQAVAEPGPAPGPGAGGRGRGGRCGKGEKGGRGKGKCGKSGSQGSQQPPAEGHGVLQRLDDTAWLERVQKQLEFYFSDGNLRRDAFMRRKIAEDDGFVTLKTFLQFNRVRALKCRSEAHLQRAVRRSEMLVLSEDQTKVKRDYVKNPQVEDKGSRDERMIYVEGVPVIFGIDDFVKFFGAYGLVRWVDLPRHRETREPRGFVFIEFAAVEEAVAAVEAVDGSWPSTWPVRNDAKALRAMMKARWSQLKQEYRELQRTARTVGTAPRHGAAVGGDPGAAADATPAEPASSSTAQAAPPAGAARGRGGRRGPPGCLLRLSGFSQPQSALSVRQFVEHAVAVEYCDFPGPHAAVAHLRLARPEDTQHLLQDLRQTRRLLGWLRPEVHVLSPEEEDAYWADADRRRAERDARPEPTEAALPEVSWPSSAAMRRSRRATRLNAFASPRGSLRGGPVRTTLICRYEDRPPSPRGRKAPVADGPPEPAAAAAAEGAGERLATEATAAPPAEAPAAAAAAPAGQPTSAAVPAAQVRAGTSFIDTVGGNAGFVQAGFGRRLHRRRMFAELRRRAAGAAAGTAEEAGEEARKAQPPRMRPPPKRARAKAAAEAAAEAAAKEGGEAAKEGGEGGEGGSEPAARPAKAPRMQPPPRMRRPPRAAAGGDPAEPAAEGEAGAAEEAAGEEAPEARRARKRRRRGEQAQGEAERPGEEEPRFLLPPPTPAPSGAKAKRRARAQTPAHLLVPPSPAPRHVPLGTPAQRSRAQSPEARSSPHQSAQRRGGRKDPTLWVPPPSPLARSAAGPAGQPDAPEAAGDAPAAAEGSKDTVMDSLLDDAADILGILDD